MSASARRDATLAGIGDPSAAATNDELQRTVAGAGVEAGIVAEDIDASGHVAAGTGAFAIGLDAIGVNGGAIHIAVDVISTEDGRWNRLTRRVRNSVYRPPAQFPFDRLQRPMFGVGQTEAPDDNDETPDGQARALAGGSREQATGHGRTPH
ncbi:MAG: hypothetical protein QNJ13_11090 [Paracoccaceae bacterium]|nr:hypothetical protein [Paracoccaceae bacterium]